MKHRLNSRWKYIFIDDSKKDTKYYELDELGKILKGVSQPKMVSIRRKYNLINEDIKELLKNLRSYPKKTTLSFTGNVEIFSRENNYEKYFTTTNLIDNKTEKEKDCANVEKDNHETDNEKDGFNFWNFLDFNIDEKSLLSDTEFDDIF